MSISKQKKDSILEFILFSLLCIGLIFRCLVGNQGWPFNCDEMQSVALFNKGLGGALNLFWREQILPAPPLYVLLGGVWMSLFGLSDLAIRGFSCASLFAGAAILWLHLRRSYGVWVTAFAVAIPFTSVAAITNNLSEGRYYGLYIAVVALFIVGILNSYFEASFRHLAIQAVAAAMVVTSHFHGLFYVSFVTLLVFIPLVKQGRVREAVGVAVASGLGCLALLSWLFPLLSYSHALNFSVSLQDYLKELLKTYFWIIPLPGRGILDACHYLNPNNAVLPLIFLGVVGGLLVVSLMLNVPFDSAHEGRPPKPRDTQLQTVIGLGLFLLPLLFWIGAFIHPTIFVHRYLTPSVLWLPFLLAPLLNSDALAGRLKGALPLILFFMLLVNVVGTGLRGWNERIVVGQDNIKQLGTDIPVVFVDVGEWAAYCHETKRADFYFITDKERALGDECLDSDRTSFYISQGFRHQGFEGVLDLPEFVKAHDSFLIVTHDNFKFLDGLFLSNPAYISKFVGNFPTTMHYPVGAKIWKVERR